ncbi:MAG: trypsin-like peptidase domain-containing protein [Oligoflexales bacterium]|nr:trypsin-like peptidase domain-containing protein [Oligoflexales bacterium]
MKKNRFQALICLFAILSIHVSCGPTSTPSRLNQIIGADDRYQAEDDILQSSIGGIGVKYSNSGSEQYSYHYFCTAFAINKNEIITASHCVEGGSQDRYYSTFIFQTYKSLKENRKPIEASISLLLPESDIAVLQTKVPMENWLSSSLHDPEPGNIPGYIVSFEAKKNILLTSNVGSFTQEIQNSSGAFLHTFDTMPGASGSPIFQGGKVVAVHLGAIIDSRNNSNKYNYSVSLKNKDLAKLPDWLRKKIQQEGMGPRVLLETIAVIVGIVSGIDSIYMNHWAETKDKSKSVNEKENKKETNKGAETIAQLKQGKKDIEFGKSASAGGYDSNGNRIPRSDRYSNNGYIFEVDSDRTKVDEVNVKTGQIVYNKGLTITSSDFYPSFEPGNTSRGTHSGGTSGSSSPGSSSNSGSSSSPNARPNPDETEEPNSPFGTWLPTPPPIRPSGEGYDGGEEMALLTNLQMLIKHDLLAINYVYLSYRGRDATQDELKSAYLLLSNGMSFSDLEKMIKEVPRTLSDMHTGCLQQDPHGNACTAAIHRYVTKKGVGTVGLVREVIEGASFHIFDIAAINAPYVYDRSIKELQSYHPDCAFPHAQSNECIAAVHRACKALGYSAGLTQEVGEQVYTIACFNADLYEKISVSNGLATTLNGCKFPNARDTSCVSAINVACRNRGYDLGLSQEVNEDTFEVACMRSKWHESVKVYVY